MRPRLILGLLGLLLASSCTSVPLLPMPPTPGTRSAVGNDIIRAENTAGLSELKQLTDGEGGAIAAVAYTPDGQELLVVHVPQGSLKRWHIGAGRLVDTLAIGPIGLGAASFDERRALVATGAGAAWKTHKDENKYLDYRIWDTHTGELVYEQLVKPYSLPIERTLVPQVLLSPDGSWVLYISASAEEALAEMKSLDMDGIVTQQTGNVFVKLDRLPEEDDYDVIAFDRVGDLFAAADESGKVAIFPFRPPEYPTASAVVEKPNTHGATPLALAFDYRRKWLARMRGTELVVWDLQRLAYPRHIQASVGEKAGVTASLAFSANGDVLAVGTINGWQIWDVPTGKLLRQSTGVEVYAVAFSPDGRLFTWGDATGVVHVWGIAGP